MRSDNYPLRSLTDLVEIYDSMRVPVKKADRSAGPYPYYGASGVTDYVDSYLFDGEYLLLAEDGENLKTQNGPIVFLATGKFWVNNHAHVLKGNASNDTRFLYYALKIADVSGYLSGSTRPKLTQGDMKRIPIYAPPLPEQHAIAHVLGTLDDKIELNRKMNATLEAMAQVTFKSWFVDFDPVRAKVEGEEPVGMDAETAALFPDAFEEVDGREVPKGWSMGTVGQIADIIDCLHAKKPERRDSGRPFLQLWNIRDDGLIDMTNTYHILEEDYLKWISRIEASAGDCVITNVGRVGAVSQIPEGLKAALGRNMTAIRCKSDFNYPTFLIELLLSDFMRKEIAAKTDDGTILSALNVRNIPKLKVIIPPIVTVDRFESIARPIRKKMEENLKQSRTLTALRDTLLPKLISGEIRVPDAMLEAAEA